MAARSTWAGSAPWVAASPRAVASRPAPGSARRRSAWSGVRTDGCGVAEGVAGGVVPGVLVAGDQGRQAEWPPRGWRGWCRWRSPRRRCGRGRRSRRSRAVRGGSGAWCAVASSRCSVATYQWCWSRPRVRGDVQRLAGHLRGDQGVGGVDGAALGAVGGGGVGELDDCRRRTRRAAGRVPRWSGARTVREPSPWRAVTRPGVAVLDPVPAAVAGQARAGWCG